MKLSQFLVIPRLRSRVKADHTSGLPLVVAVISVSLFKGKVDQWTKELKLLSNIAASQPHAAFAIATVPLISKLSDSVDQVWYADDAAATGKVSRLRYWWDDIEKYGPSIGYHANVSKTWLVVKPDYFDEAKSVFGDTEVKITCEGRPYLGTALGSRSYISEFVKGKVDQWTKN